MSNVPQPSPEPYSIGERIRVYLGPDDPDADYHDTVCEVTEVHTDDLGEETGRPTDAYAYTLCVADTGETLPQTFRHRDLVPAEK
jgi:hypothetical protein